MSKKHKKFKKKFKAEILAELSKTKDETFPDQSSRVVTASQPQEFPQPTVSEANLAESSVAIRDLKTIALIFGALITILVILFFINSKTPYLNDLSNILAKALHFQ